jgi:DNA helicase-2/ATP-dependent DNA helicase PcrA
LLVNPFDWLSFTRAIGEPGRGVGDKSLSKIQPLVASLSGNQEEVLDQAAVLNQLLTSLTTISIPTKSRTGTQQFILFLQSVLALGPALKLDVVLEYIFVHSGLKAALRDGTEQGEERVENVQELLTVAQKYQEATWQEALIAFLEEVTLMQDGDSKNEDDPDTVTMMTLHSAKGLEFDTVFFVGLEEGILPHSRSLLDPEELAEEVRLAYVGITRARKRLFLVYAEERSLYGGGRRSLPSRILRVLPLDSVENRAPMFHRYSEGGVSYEPLTDF